MKIHSSDIISACAICLTLYGLYATRRHYRLSMTPHITGCSNKNLTDQGFTLSYVVSNNGIGPARIKKFSLFHNGKIFPKGNGDYVESLSGDGSGGPFKHSEMKRQNIDRKFAGIIYQLRNAIVHNKEVDLHITCISLSSPMESESFSSTQGVVRSSEVTITHGSKGSVVLRLDEILSAFNGEHDVNINLRAGVGHKPEDAAPDGA